MPSVRLREFVAQDAQRREPVDRHQLGDLQQIIAGMGDADAKEFLDQSARRALYFIRVTLAAKLRAAP